jgi:putative methyltransferase (TIGR04325 family)
MKELLKKIPFIKKTYRQYTAAQYEQKFANDCYGCFWGVFDTFEDAIRAAPATKSIGYDCADLAQEYQRMLDGGDWETSKSLIRSFDYPVLYWLGRIAQSIPLDRAKFFDFGGNVGIHFVSYSEYLNFPASLAWIVCDLPEIVKVGALGNKDPRLTFTTDFELASGSDIFLASGSIQYDADITLKLKALADKPKHILINRVGWYDGNKIVTLQNGGKVFYPQYIFNRTEFINSFQLIGYELIDIWEDNVDSCSIPFHPEVNVPCYHGLYFRLNSGGAQ